mgnify:CR=1 FL=1
MMRLLLSVLLLGVMFTPLAAQDGLYAPRLDGETALVRVVNLQHSLPVDRLDIGPRRFGDIPPGGAGAYRSLAPGVYLVGGRDGVMLSPPPGSFRTVVVSGDGSPIIVDDTAHRDPARAQVVLYNFSSQPLSLLAPELQAVLLPEVAPGQSAARAVNALTVDLSVNPPAGDARPVGTLELRRGESYGIFVTTEAVYVHQARVVTD